MLTVGVDLAAQPSKTAACVIRWSAEGAVVDELRSGLTDDDLLEDYNTSNFERVGVDCPFGWPSSFVDAITAHRRFEPWPGRHLDSNAFRRGLRLRSTDVHVHEQTGLHPLSVSASLLAVTTMRLAGILDRLAADGHPVARDGSGRFVEVYPAASLVRWGVDINASYKTGPGSSAALNELVGQLRKEAPWLHLGEYETKLCQSDHAVDALLCALTARACALEATDLPPGDLSEAARTEGWIHLPKDDQALTALLAAPQ